MQASSLWATQRSAEHVVAQRTLISVSASKFYVPSSSRRHHGLTNPVVHGTRRMTRSVSSTPSSRNHLRDAKDYTAANPVSIWKSNSHNPYENLAIEHYLLKNSDPASRILFTYVNWPCVVIGRNQNPWLECNLARMQRGIPHHQLGGNQQQDDDTHIPRHGRRKEGELVPLDLVRRRSGGGTVIHDAGNLNFSFIVPNDLDFTRDTHAQLVVSMLEELRREGQMESYYSSVRVNERHDIVMKHRAAQGRDTTREFKVSGSAFKLTRGRALHHGTILHSSPNIPDLSDEYSKGSSIFSEILSSPARPFLDAKGVGSVRSAVHNLFRAEDSSQRASYSQELQRKLQKTFQASHKMKDIPIHTVGSLDCTEGSNKQIFDDIQEMLTDEWRFCQTPSFDFASSIIGDVKIHFQVKHGIIGALSVKDTSGSPIKGNESLANLEGKKLHTIADWSTYISPSLGPSTSMISHIGTVFPQIDGAKQDPYRSIDDTEVKVEARNAGKEDVVVIERRSAKGSVETEREGENLVAER